ncbi:MAG: energy transducer TonB [Deltaproteobacteria bacterium]|nr:energy transducer TonB [Deltaproteobacteria bacterium]
MAKQSVPQMASSTAPKGAAAGLPKILRIGVIQAGKIVEERLIRRRESVTIGASPSNSIVVPASSLPKKFTLFELRGNQYHMVFSDAMDGRVSVNNQVLSLEQIRQGGLAQQAGGKGLLSVALNEGSRGKVLLGEVTLLFQFVAPPPVQPRPQLPPSVRGSFFTNMDWTLATSFVTVGVLNFAFIIYLKTVDFPRKPDLEAIPDDFAEYVPTVQEPKKALDLSKISKEGEKQAEKAEKVPAKKEGGGGQKKKAAKAPPCDDACQQAKAEARRARLAEQVARLGALRLLGVKGRGGAAEDLIKGGDPGTKLDNALKGVGGLRVGGKGTQGLRPRGGSGTGKSVGIGDLGGRVGGPGEVGTGGMVSEKVPKAVVKAAHKVDTGTMNEDAVGRIIRQGMAAIRACYQRALKRNPKLTGKVDVRIKVNAMGRTTGVDVEGDSVGDPTVATCIKSFASRWRFPPPEGGPAEIAVPFVFQASN